MRALFAVLTACMSQEYGASAPTPAPVAVQGLAGTERVLNGSANRHEKQSVFRASVYPGQTRAGVQLPARDAAQSREPFQRSDELIY